MTAWQNSSYMVNSDMANDQLVSKRNAFKDTLKTLTSFNIDVTNSEVCAQDRPLWRSMIHTGARTAETIRIAEAQKKRAARKARLYSPLLPSPQPARHTHAPNVEECCRPELDRLATSAPTGSTKHDIIIIIEEVMVIIGNDGRTTIEFNLPLWRSEKHYQAH